jgi:hypothetical protein
MGYSLQWTAMNVILPLIPPYQGGKMIVQTGYNGNKLDRAQRLQFAVDSDECNSPSYPSLPRREEDRVNRVHC